MKVPFMIRGEWEIDMAVELGSYKITEAKQTTCTSNIDISMNSISVLVPSENPSIFRNFLTPTKKNFFCTF